MSKTLKAEIKQLIKDDFGKEGIEIKDLKVSFTITESAETDYELEDDTADPTSKPGKKKRGPTAGKKKGRRGRKKGSKNKTKDEKPSNPDIIPGGSKESD